MAAKLIKIPDEFTRLYNIQKSKDIAYIFISHDLKLIKKSSDKVIIMQKGRIVEKNNTKDIFSQPVEKYTKKLIESSFLD